MKALALVEGPTEETFVAQVLGPHFSARNVWLTPVVLTTKRLASGVKMRGGVSTWPKIEREIHALLGDSSANVVTTMLDLYGFPEDAPGMLDSQITDPYDRVKAIEGELGRHIDDPRFLPYLSLHEFEALVLASASSLEALSEVSGIAADLAAVVSSGGGPELVDKDFPPSRHIRGRWPRYQKVFHGPLATQDAGVDYLCRSCPHFAAWLGSILSRA